MNDEKWFWQIIDQSRNGKKKIDHGQQVGNLTRILSSLRPEEIVSFDSIFYDLLGRSHRSELWAAAFIINGGCSDDTFHYFRSWLIGQGESVYYNALSDPETLIAVVKPGEDREWEGLEYCAADAYEAITGREIHDPLAKSMNGKDVILGWKETDLPLMFPKLWKKFAAQFPHLDKGGSRTADPTRISVDYRATQIPDVSFWIERLRNKHHDVGGRSIDGDSIHLRHQVTGGGKGIAINHISQKDGRVVAEFENFEKRMSGIFLDLSLVMCDLDDARISTGRREYSATEWKKYLTTLL